VTRYNQAEQQRSNNQQSPSSSICSITASEFISKENGVTMKKKLHEILSLLNN